MSEPSRRKYIRTKDRLASALADLLPEDVRNELREAKVDPDVVISMFQLDHNVPVALDGTNDWWNLTHLQVAAHAVKTKRDVKAIAKARRYEKLEYASSGRTAPKRKWPSRKMPSRPFPKRSKVNERD